MARRKRKPRVPATFADRLERVAAVMDEHSTGPGLYRVTIQHDDDCPALERQSLRACTCQPWVKPPRRIA